MPGSDHVPQIRTEIIEQTITSQIIICEHLAFINVRKESGEAPQWCRKLSFIFERFANLIPSTSILKIFLSVFSGSSDLMKVGSPKRKRSSRIFHSWFLRASNAWMVKYAETMESSEPVLIFSFRKSPTAPRRWFSNAGL